MLDVVIIGSGPAGLSAAIYAKRAGLMAITLEKNPMSGGQILNTYEVDNYPGLPGSSGFDMGMKFREHADRLGCEFRTASVLRIKRNCEGAAELKAASLDQSCEDKESDICTEGFAVETDEGTLYTKTVVAATGAYHARLNIPGEETFAGRGVSYCATCDGAFFRGKTAAVIGGGDVAVEDAVFLARGCKKVYLIHRRDELRSAKILQDQVKALPNVEILWDTVVEEIEGGENVRALRLKNVRSGAESRLEADGVFVAVGIVPDSSLLRELVSCDGKGYVMAGEDCVTSLPGVFAAGDVRTKKLRQIITAASDGANAITSVQEYLLNLKAESE